MPQSYKYQRSVGSGTWRKLHVLGPDLAPSDSGNPDFVLLSLSPCLSLPTLGSILLFDVGAIERSSGTICDV